MATKKKSRNILFWILSAIMTLGGLAIAWLVLIHAGERSGIEFSPDDFSMREFNYCRLPWLGRIHRGIEYEDYPNPNGQILVADDWIRVTGRAEKRWDLVSEQGGRFFQSGKPPADCDARFLTRYLSMRDTDGDVAIMKWTDENPVSAKVFWPLIAELARDQVYLPIPQLMEFVLNYKQPDKADSFESELHGRVSDAWYQAGMTDQLGGFHKRAIRRFDKAVNTGDGHQLAEQAGQVSRAASP